METFKETLHTRLSLFGARAMSDGLDRIVEHTEDAEALILQAHLEDKRQMLMRLKGRVRPENGFFIVDACFIDQELEKLGAKDVS